MHRWRRKHWGIKFEDVHVISTAGYGRNALRYRLLCLKTDLDVAGFAIRQTAELLKEKILKHANELTRMPVYNLDIKDGNIVRTTDNKVLMTLGELSTEVLYSVTNCEHITAESTYLV